MAQILLFHKDCSIRISGYIDLESGAATVLESRPLPDEAVDSLILPDSDFTLAFLDSSGVLQENGFVFNIPLGQEHWQPPYPAQYAMFTVIRTVPVGTETVEIRFQGDTAWEILLMNLAGLIVWL